MALRNIVKEGDPILRAKCRPVEKFDAKLGQLLDDMGETLKKADGVGLAAPQVGIRRRIFVMDVDDGSGVLEMINPEITFREGEQREVEGCLSIPNKWGYVKRPKHIKLKAQNRKGETIEYDLKDLAARCACHESDHLDGVLFVDLVDEYVEPKDVK